jgi:hypothetical protein
MVVIHPKLGKNNFTPFLFKMEDVIFQGIIKLASHLVVESILIKFSRTISLSVSIEFGKFLTEIY